VSGGEPAGIASIVTLAERPDLVEAVSGGMVNTWSEFLHHDAVGNLFVGRLAETFPEYQLVAVDGSGSVVGKVHGVPFAWDGKDESLPDRGWDGILEQAFADHARGVWPTAASLIEARLAPGLRGRGLSYALLDAARRTVRGLGVDDLVGPVRPTGKATEPRTPMTEYAGRRRADGLPADAWLRAHVRVGGRIVKVCPVSMTISGTLGDWRAWTGLALEWSGLHDVPGGLAPVHVSVEHDHAVYVEANVWVHHDLTAEPGVRVHDDLTAGPRG
jgi:GNAT superfamily N-acetyltransferase